MKSNTQKIDFSKGPVWKCIIAQAVPLTIAQLVQLLYNVVDRIYIGHMGDGNSIALTGVGLTFPIVTLIMAFTALFAWLLIVLFPRFWFGIFSDDVLMMETGIGALKIYFFGFVFMAFQFAGQSTFQALGDAKHAIFFSLLRKAIIVAPLTLLLPKIGFGVNGVFLAEPISNVIGGIACYLTMRMTVYKKIENEIANHNGRRKR